MANRFLSPFFVEPFDRYIDMEVNDIMTYIGQIAARLF